MYGTELDLSIRMLHPLTIHNGQEDFFHAYFQLERRNLHDILPITLCHMLTTTKIPTHQISVEVPNDVTMTKPPCCKYPHLCRQVIDWWLFSLSHLLPYSLLQVACPHPCNTTLHTISPIIAIKLHSCTSRTMSDPYAFSTGRSWYDLANTLSQTAHSGHSISSPSSWHWCCPRQINMLFTPNHISTYVIPDN